MGGDASPGDFNTGGGTGSAGNNSISSGAKDVIFECKKEATARSTGEEWEGEFQQEPEGEFQQERRASPQPHP